MKRACNENKRRVVHGGEKSWRHNTTRKSLGKSRKNHSPASAKVVTRRNDESASYGFDDQSVSPLLSFNERGEKDLWNCARETGETRDLVISKSEIFERHIRFSLPSLSFCL